MNVFVLLVALGVSTFHSGEESVSGSPGLYKRWLGGQSKGTYLGQNGLPRDITSVKLKVVKGEDVALSDDDYIVALKNNRPGVIGSGDIPIQGNRKYIIGTIDMPDSQVAVYRLDVEITKGPLKSAIVHLRDGRLPVVGKRIARRLMCVYEIPEDVVVEAGDLEFVITGLIVQ